MLLRLRPLEVPHDVPSITFLTKVYLTKAGQGDARL